MLKLLPTAKILCFLLVESVLFKCSAYARSKMFKTSKLKVAFLKTLYFEVKSNTENSGVVNSPKVGLILLCFAEYL